MTVDVRLPLNSRWTEHVRMHPKYWWLQEAAPGLDSVLNMGGAVKSAAPEEPIHEPQERKGCCRG